MSLPVLRVRHHGVIGGNDGDVLVCASVGPAGEAVAVWTAPDGLGPVTSTTVSAAGASFPDPAADRPVAARITVHTLDLAAVTPIADLVGFQNLIVASDLQRYSRTGSRHATRSYPWISPPRTLRRRISAVARSVTGAVLMSS